MPFQPAENVVAANMYFTWQGQQVMNKIHFIMDPITPQGMSDLAAQVYIWWVTHLSTIVSSTVLLRGVEVVDLTTQDGGTAFYANNPLQGGSNLTESVVNSTSLAVSLKTGGRGRSRRGRIFHIGLVDELVANNRVSQAGLNALLNGYGELMDATTISAGQFCVLSRQFNNVKRPVASAATVTAVSFANDVIDNQRRRLPGRGN